MYCTHTESLYRSRSCCAMGMLLLQETSDRERFNRPIDFGGLLRPMTYMSPFHAFRYFMQTHKYQVPQDINHCLINVCTEITFSRIVCWGKDHYPTKESCDCRLLKHLSVRTRSMSIAIGILSAEEWMTVVDLRTLSHLTAGRTYSSICFPLLLAVR